VHLPFDSSSGSPLSTRAIFVAEEDEKKRASFRAALRDAGVTNPCRFFPNGEAMIDALFSVLRGKPPPLLCFLDVKMDGMCGLDVLRWIRLQDILAGVSIVMLSSDDGPDPLDEIRRCGAQCCAKKYPGAAQLQQIVSEAKKFATVAPGESAFNLPCNLLRAAQPT